MQNIKTFVTYESKLIGLLWAKSYINNTSAAKFISKFNRRVTQHIIRRALRLHAYNKRPSHAALAHGPTANAHNIDKIICAPASRR